MVLAEPLLQVSLEVGHVGVNLLPKRHAVELVEHSLVQAFDDAISLGTLHFGAGMVDIFPRPIQLLVVGIRTAPVLGPPIGQEPAQWDFRGIKERHHLSIQ
jgi:hypothetical protein